MGSIIKWILRKRDLNVRSSRSDQYPWHISKGPVYVSSVVSYSLAYHAAEVMDNDNLATAVLAQIKISIALIGMVIKLLEKPIVLAKRWGITPEKAWKTIQAITQRGILTMLYPSLLRQFRTNERNLCYYCLAHPVFSDMMFAITVSRKGNRCEHVYAKDFWWARAFPMASRNEAHETLLLLFAWDGVTPACTCNNAKEMVQGKFYQKCKDTACHLIQ